MAIRIVYFPALFPSCSSSSAALYFLLLMPLYLMARAAVSQFTYPYPSLFLSREHVELPVVLFHELMHLLVRLNSGLSMLRGLSFFLYGSANYRARCSYLFVFDSPLDDILVVKPVLFLV